MSGSTTLARPYARAAFELARDSGALAHWQAALAFSAEVADASEARTVIGDPRAVEAELVRLVLPPGEAADGGYARFLAHVASNRRLALLRAISDEFEALKRDHERVLRVTVRSAAPIEDAALETLRSALAKRYARTIELQQTLDPELIGGAVIDAGNEVIDGSVRGRLARLEQALTT